MQAEELKYRYFSGQRTFNSLRMMGEDLSNFKFEGVLFDGCDFEDTIFDRSSFRQCQFRDCCLFQISAEHSCFQHCHIVQCDMTEADLRWSNFYDSSLSLSTLSSCYIEGSTGWPIFAVTLPGSKEHFVAWESCGHLRSSYGRDKYFPHSGALRDAAIKDPALRPYYAMMGVIRDCLSSRR